MTNRVRNAALVDECDHRMKLERNGVICRLLQKDLPLYFHEIGLSDHLLPRSDHWRMAKLAIVVEDLKYT